MPGSWNKRWCLFAPVDLRGPLPIELRDEAAAPGDGIVAEPVPHRIHRLVDLATGGAGTAEQVALENLAGLDEIMGADADQAEGTPVGLAGEERLGGPEHLLGRLRGVLQVAGAGDGAEVRGLEL